MTAEVNIPLLRKAVEWAEAEAAKPEIDSRWRQESWITSPVIIATDLIDDADPYSDYDERRAAVDVLAPHCGTAFCVAGFIGQALDERYAKAETVDGVHVAEFAANALGINVGAAECDGGLFFGANDIADVRRIAEDIAGERL